MVLTKHEVRCGFDTYHLPINLSMDSHYHMRSLGSSMCLTGFRVRHIHNGRRGFIKAIDPKSIRVKWDEDELALSLSISENERKKSDLYEEESVEAYHCLKFPISFLDALLERYCDSPNIPGCHMIGSWNPFKRDPQTQAFLYVTHVDCAANENLQRVGFIHSPPSKFASKSNIPPSSRLLRMGQFFPNLMDVHLNETLLSKWSSIRCLSRELKNLRSLSFDSNPMGSIFSTSSARKVIKVNEIWSSSLVYLSVCQTKITESDLTFLLLFFPALEELRAASNNWGSGPMVPLSKLSLPLSTMNYNKGIHSTSSKIKNSKTVNKNGSMGPEAGKCSLWYLKERIARTFLQLKVLWLENNQFKSFSHVARLFDIVCYPSYLKKKSLSLEGLNLSNNPISHICKLPKDSLIKAEGHDHLYFSSLSFLWMRNCSSTFSLTDLDILCHKTCPSLRHLNFTLEHIYDQLPPFISANLTTEDRWYLIITLLAKRIKKLNNSEITAVDRQYGKKRLYRFLSDNPSDHNLLPLPLKKLFKSISMNPPTASESTCSERSSNFLSGFFESSSSFSSHTPNYEFDSQPENEKVYSSRGIVNEPMGLSAQVSNKCKFTQGLGNDMTKYKCFSASTSIRRKANPKGKLNINYSYPYANSVEMASSSPQTPKTSMLESQGYKLNAAALTENLAEAVSFGSETLMSQSISVVDGNIAPTTNSTADSSRLTLSGEENFPSSMLVSLKESQFVTVHFIFLRYTIQEMIYQWWNDGFLTAIQLNLACYGADEEADEPDSFVVRLDRMFNELDLQLEESISQQSFMNLHTQYPNESYDPISSKNDKNIFLDLMPEGPNVLCDDVVTSVILREVGNMIEFDQVKSIYYLQQSIFHMLKKNLANNSILHTSNCHTNWHEASIFLQKTSKSNPISPKNIDICQSNTKSAREETSDPIFKGNHSSTGYSYECEREGNFFFPVGSLILFYVDLKLAMNESARKKREHCQPLLHLTDHLPYMSNGDVVISIQIVE